MFYYNGKYIFRDAPNREIWIYGDLDGKMYYCTDGFTEKSAKLYYKHPTGYGCYKYGLYVNAVFPDGGKKRIYLMDLHEYR